MSSEYSAPSVTGHQKCHAAHTSITARSRSLHLPCPLACQITDELVRSGAVDLVVLDSVAALVPRAELEGEMGMLQVGLQARLMSQGLRKLTGNASRSSATIIFLNQIRHKVGGWGQHG